MKDFKFLSTAVFVLAILGIVSLFGFPELGSWAGLLSIIAFFGLMSNIRQGVHEERKARKRADAEQYLPKDTEKDFEAAEARVQKGLRIRIPLGIVLCIFLIGFYSYIKVADSFYNLKWPFRIIWVIEFLMISGVCLWYWAQGFMKTKKTAQRSR